MKRACCSSGVSGRIGGLGEKSAPAFALPRPIGPPRAGGGVAVGGGFGVCVCPAGGGDCANTEKHAAETAITLAEKNHTRVESEPAFIMISGSPVSAI